METDKETLAHPNQSLESFLPSEPIANEEAVPSSAQMCRRKEPRIPHRGFPRHTKETVTLSSGLEERHRAGRTLGWTAKQSCVEGWVARDEALQGLILKQTTPR